MESDPESQPGAVEWYIHFAHLADQREAELGHPAENCPTAADLWSLAETTKAILAANRTPAEIWSYMQELAAVSDKWVDPENDPIGADLYDVIEETIFNLRNTVDKAVPEGAENSQKWADARALQHCIARQVYRESLNPSLPKKLWQRLFGR